MEENILVKVGADISDLSSGMAKAGKEVQTFSSRMEGFGKNMRDIGGGIALSFGAIATGITVPLKQAVQTSVDFDSAMRRAATIAGATEKEFDALKKTALDLGAKTTKSAQEVAVAMSEMAAKGYDVNQIIAAMPGVIAAAEASGEDLALTADTVSSALNAFGLKASEASRVADILAQTANDSAAGIVDMSYAFKYAAPVVSSLGVSIEELAAATGIMADVGIRGEQAGTTLRGGLVQLLKPAEKTAKMMKSMGIEVTDANGKFLGLAGIIRELQTAMEGQTETQKLQTLASIVGTEAASGFLALMKAGPDKIDAMTKSLENSAGASAKAAKKMMGGLGGAIEQMSGSFETMKIIVGDHLTPTIQRSVEWVTKLIEAFNNAPPKLQKFISVAALVLATLTGFIAVVGTVAAGIGLFMMSIAPLLPFLTKLGGKLKVVGGLFAFLTSPISIAVIAVGALVAGFIALYKHSEPFRNSVNQIGSTLKGAFFVGVEKASEVLTKLKNVFIELVNTKVAPFFESVADVISRAFSGDFSGVAQMFGQLVPTIIGFLVGGIPALILTGAKFLPAIAEGIQQNLPALLSGITAVVDGIITAITTYLPIFVQAGVDVLTKLIEGITNAIPIILPAILAIVTTLITTIAKFLPQFVQAGVTVLTSLLNGLVNALPLIVGAILTLVTTILGVITENLPLIITAGITILTALIEGIISLLPAIIDAVLSIILTIAQAVIDNLPKIIDAGIKILDALIDGIISILPQLLEAGIMLIFALFGALIDNLPKILDAGVKILVALIDGIMKILPQLLLAGLTLIIKLAGALIQNLPKILAAGGKILLALLDGIAELIPKLLSLGWDLVKKLAGAIDDKVGDMFDVGANLIKGLWNGINSVKDWIIGKIGGFASGVVKAVKGFFGVHSPSKVFRDEIGKMLGLGLADGMLAMKSDVIGAAERLSKWATPETPDVSLAYATPAGTYGTLSSAISGTVDVNSRDDMIASAVNLLAQKLDGLAVEMDGKQVGKLVAPTVSREIKRETDNAIIGGGRRARI